MWTCLNCRAENDDNATTCAHCGEKMIPPKRGEDVPPKVERKTDALDVPSEAKTLRNTATVILILCIIAGIIALIAYGLQGIAIAFGIILSACASYAVLFALARIVVDVNRIRREKTGSDDDD